MGRSILCKWVELLEVQIEEDGKWTYLGTVSLEFIKA